MTDIENTDDLSEEQEKGKKKGEGEDGAAAAGRTEVAVSPAFFEYMAGIGASKELIAEVLRTWRHFKGEGLMRRMMDFAKGLIKSSHVQVEIDRNKDYAVVHNFIQSTKQNAPAQNLAAQHKHVAAHTPDPNLTLRPK